jgi:Domain of unknown function (DUF4190)
MSQFPPMQPMSPMSPMPPMQLPGQSPYGMGMPRRTSAAAVVSLICGILGCLVITPLVAIICGIVGIVQTKDPRYTGRGMAIAGIILGLLWIAGAAFMGAGGYWMYAKTKPVAQEAHQFTADLASGNVSAAMSRCEPTITQESLQATADQMNQWGSLQDMTIPVRTMESNNGQTVWTLVGGARFSNSPASHAVIFKLKPQQDGTYKITEYKFQ